MPNNYRQISWGSETEAEAKRLVAAAKHEDLADGMDWTSLAVTGNQPRSRADVVARGDVVLAGLPIVPILINEFGVDLKTSGSKADGQQIGQGEAALRIEGSAYDLLTIERTLLNLLGHLSGIATATAAYVEKTAGTPAAIYDTRKTLPAWRYLQKYAVRCGGGNNHRLGLHDAILIKDNHIALMAQQLNVPLEEAPLRAVEAARAMVSSRPAELPVVVEESDSDLERKLVFPLEIEVDSLGQLERVLPAKPDIVLLDNMVPDQLRRAVVLRDRIAGEVILEASGTINLETVREVALAGVDRISVGALTHSVVVADLGLDWDVDS